MCDLAPHCENKQNDPIAEKYWPKDWDVEERKECHHKRNEERLSHGVPGNSLKGYTVRYQRKITDIVRDLTWKGYQTSEYKSLRHSSASTLH